jgi:hypothetical protein
LGDNLVIGIFHPHRVPHLKGKISQLALIAPVGVHQPQLLTATGRAMVELLRFNESSEQQVRRQRDYLASVFPLD